MLAMTYLAADDRYSSMTYRRAGRSGVLLPAISLGLWHNFGDTQPLDVQRAVLRRAFDRGVNHFDLANNYGPPYGSAERRWRSCASSGRRCSSTSRATRSWTGASRTPYWTRWPRPRPA